MTAFQGTESQFFTQLKNDLFGGNGQSGFVFWAVAIGVVGGIGYIPGFKPLSNAFLILLLIVLFLASAKNRQGGFFAAFQQQLQTIPVSQTGVPIPGIQGNALP